MRKYLLVTIGVGALVAPLLALAANNRGPFRDAAAGNVTSGVTAGAGVDNALTRYNGTTGTQMQDSNIICSDTGALTGVYRLTFDSNSGATVTNTSYIESTTASQIVFGDGTNTTTLTLGTNELQVNDAVIITSTSTNNDFSITANTAANMAVTSDGTAIWTLNSDSDNSGDDSAGIRIRSNGSTVVGEFEWYDVFSLLAINGNASSNVNIAGGGGSVAIGTAGDSPDHLLDVVRSSSGSTLVSAIRNSSDTASSAAGFRAEVAGTSAGDAFADFIVSGSNSYRIGVDRDASGAFVLAYHATGTPSLGTGNLLSVSTSGDATLTGTLAVNGDSITADGATLTINAAGTVNIQDALTVDGDYTSTQTDAAKTILTTASDTEFPWRHFQRARAGTAIVADADTLGVLEWKGYDGDSYEYGASIFAAVDGTPGAGTDMPTRLVFQTTPDGSATPATRMIMDNTGAIGVGTAMAHGATFPGGPMIMITDDDPKIILKDTSTNEDDWLVEAEGNNFILRVDRNDDQNYNDSGEGPKFAVDPAGKVSITAADTDYALYVLNDGNAAGRNGILVQAGEDDGSTGSDFITFFDGDGTTSGTIAMNGSGALLYNDTSDSRLKRDTGKTPMGLADLMRVRIHNFIWKRSGVESDGVFAQELQKVLPIAVTEGTDEMEADGLPRRPWMVDYSKLVPMIVQAVQDVAERIAALWDSHDDHEARIAELEAQNAALTQSNTILTQSFTQSFTQLSARLAALEALEGARP